MSYEALSRSNRKDQEWDTHLRWVNCTQSQKEEEKEEIPSRVSFSDEEWDTYLEWVNDIQSQEKEIPSKAPSVPPIAFGAKKWKTYFGITLQEPSLPHDIRETLDRPCPFWPNRKVENTHVLVLVPQDLTLNILNTLGKLINRYYNEKVQNKLGKHKTEYRYYNEKVQNKLGNNSVSKAYWVLMTHDVIPNSRDKTYDKQQQLVTEQIQKYNKHQQLVTEQIQNYNNQQQLVTDQIQKSDIHYDLPTALETVVVIFTQYVANGEKLYSNKKWTFTHCKDKIDKFPIAIGGFSPNGLSVGYDDGHWFGDHCVGCGIGVVRRFGVPEAPNLNCK